MLVITDSMPWRRIRHTMRIPNRMVVVQMKRPFRFRACQGIFARLHAWVLHALLTFLEDALLLQLVLCRIAQGKNFVHLCATQRVTMAPVARMQAASLFLALEFARTMINLMSPYCTDTIYCLTLSSRLCTKYTKGFAWK